MKLIFSVFLATLLLFGCTGTEKTASIETKENPVQKDNPEPTPGTSTEYTYYSSQLFLIYYPVGWSIDDQATNPGVFRFISPPDNEEDWILDEFIVEIWSDEDQDFGEVENMLLGAGDNVIIRKTADFKGKDAFVIEYEGPGTTDIPMYYKTTIFRNAGWIYRLHYAVEKSEMEKYQPVMESILDKFEIGSG